MQRWKLLEGIVKKNLVTSYKLQVTRKQDNSSRNKCVTGNRLWKGDKVMGRFENLKMHENTLNT